jgi:hypothetical protein
MAQSRMISSIKYQIVISRVSTDSESYVNLFRAPTTLQCELARGKVSLWSGTVAITVTDNLFKHELKKSPRPSPFVLDTKVNTFVFNKSFKLPVTVTVTVCPDYYADPVQESIAPSQAT